MGPLGSDREHVGFLGTSHSSSSSSFLLQAGSREQQGGGVGRGRAGVLLQTRRLNLLLSLQSVARPFPGYVACDRCWKLQGRKNTQVPRCPNSVTPWFTQGHTAPWGRSWSAVSAVPASFHAFFSQCPGCRSSPSGSVSGSSGNNLISDINIFSLGRRW